MSGDSPSGNGDEQLGLDDAYAVETPEDNRALYAAWADTYESDFIAGSRYVYHRHVAGIFCARFSAQSGPVLDVGCGTGIVGEELRRLGVQVIDGIDISPEMLEKAAVKAGGGAPIYRRLVEADLTGSIALDSNAYAGLISVGTFTHGHLGPEALDELLRVAAPGAVAAIGINAAHFEDHGFGDALARHRDLGVIGPYELVDAIIYDGADGDDPDQLSRVAVFRVS